MTNDDLSKTYHSLRFYDGTTSIQNIPYRIGNNTVMIPDIVEHYTDTWIDLKLIPSERPIVEIPKSNVKMVVIPGRSAPYDMTTYLTGHPTYTNRTGQWNFYTDNDYVSSIGYMEYDRILKTMFHGTVKKIILRDDPSYFYAGLITYSGLKPGNNFSSVTFAYNLFPYKKSIFSSMELWKWDDFDFKDGVIQYLKDILINGSRTVKIYGGKERISPHISGSSGIFVDKLINNTWASYGYVPTESISSSRSIIPGLVVDEGETTLRFRGNGTVTIDYRRGLL